MENTMLIMDGCNVMLTAKSWANIAKTNIRNANAIARNTFIEQCNSAYNAKFREIRLIFDGTHAQIERPFKNEIVVQFSEPREEAHNADNEILQFIEDMRRNKVNCWLVTDDKGLRSKALALGCEIINVDSLEYDLQKRL